MHRNHVTASAVNCWLQSCPVLCPVQGLAAIDAAVAAYVAVVLIAKVVGVVLALSIAKIKCANIHIFVGLLPIRWSKGLLCVA